MEEQKVTVQHSKAKEIISKLLSISIELGCVLFVVIQTYKCFSKFVKHPQGTEIRILKGYRETYPDITICPLILNNNPYEATLESCNLTYESYFHAGNWIGNNSQEFCGNSTKLFEKLAEKAFEDLTVSYMDFENYFYENPKYKYKDYPEFGRCKTFKYPAG